MNEITQKTDTQVGAPSNSPSRVLASLRDRTDELELIISSLTLFALISLPSWLFEALSQSFTHLSTSMAITGTMGITLAAGICYGLAACFIVHLMVRAYWVGLIGLRTVFPKGIDWSRTPGIGPLTQKYYKSTLPDLETVTERADRLASSLFAVISLLTIATLWLGMIVVLVLAAGGWIGARIGLTNASLGIATLALVGVFFGLPLLLWLLDSVLARRLPGLQENRAFTACVRFLRRIYGLIYPQRLVLPVQLTLQSNTRPLVFYFALVFSVTCIVVVGNSRYNAWRSFSVSNEFVYLDDGDVTEGFRSTYYEDSFSRIDRFRAWPRIDSFTQKGSFVTLFLPYQPLRDNLILDDLCADAPEDEGAAVCLRKLWSVSINDQPVDIAQFVSAERMDIKMRGLIGLVPMQGLAPGMHHINIVWNPAAKEDDVPVDDRYTEARLNFSIPIAFAPEYESSLQVSKQVEGDEEGRPTF